MSHESVARSILFPTTKVSAISPDVAAQWLEESEAIRRKFLEDIARENSMGIYNRMGSPRKLPGKMLQHVRAGAKEGATGVLQRMR